MANDDLLTGKRILIVDDEPDVLETLEGLLSTSNVEKASTFEEAKNLLETRYYDLVILDIMGVNGYELLDIANQKNLIAVMLTAHAVSVEDTVKSYKKGAASYLPKDEISGITTFLIDILEAKEKGENFWWRWLDRLGAFYERKFGPEWKNKDEDFWKNFPSW
jgi:DNA-binding NtrC family response regulator